LAAMSSHRRRSLQEGRGGLVRCSCGWHEEVKAGSGDQASDELDKAYSRHLRQVRAR
jgi:hypothetical protein